MIDIKPFDFRRDWEPFCQLYQKTFGREVNKAYCDWKFLDNPFGEALGFGAWDENRLVGFVAIWPLRFWYEGKEITACAGGDTMVDIEYRKEGLFTKLTRSLLEEMNKRGWQFRYSAPGLMSYPGYIKKLNHQLIGILPYWVKLHPVRMIYTKILGACNTTVPKDFVYKKHKYTVKAIDRFDPRFDDLWERTRRHFDLAVVRNSSYLNWRYCHHPLYSYLILSCEEVEELVGFAVIRGGNLVELWGRQNIDIYVALLGAAGAIWKISRQDISHAWFLGDQSLETALRKSGWQQCVKKKRRFGLYQEQPLICYPNANLQKPQPMLDPSIWRFSMGDVDSM